MVDVGFLASLQLFAACFSIFSPMILERIRRRKWVLAAGRLVYYLLNLVGLSVIPLLTSDSRTRLALFAALAFGLEAGYAFLSALDCREKDKDSVSYNIVWGTGALAILMLLPAVMTIIKG